MSNSKSYKSKSFKLQNLRETSRETSPQSSSSVSVGVSLQILAGIPFVADNKVHNLRGLYFNETSSNSY